MQHARNVHHLGEAERRLVLEERREGARIERAAAVRLERRRGNTRAHHHAEVEALAALETCRGVEEELNARDAEHVRELVRIADRARGASVENRALKALRHEERALEMD